MRIALVAFGMLICGAQAQEVYPLSAWIKIPANKDAFKVEIHEGTRNGQAKMALPGQRQTRPVRIDTIEKISFVYPPAVNEALEAVERREFEQAGDVLMAYSDAILPFSLIPENNVARIVDQYEHSLHQRNEGQRLRELYTKLLRLNDPVASRRAEVWLAYLDAREGGSENTQDFFLDPAIRADSGEEFFLQQMALCRSYMTTEAYRTAIDHSARVISLGSIENMLYPEALHLSAQCYDGLAQAEQERLNNVRSETVEKEVLLERVRVALELEAKADKDGTPPPTEQDILDAVDRNAVEARIPPVPPISENAFAHIAQRLYFFNERVFPSTYWGTASRKQVWQETRAASEKDLTTFVPPDTTK